MKTLQNTIRKGKDGRAIMTEMEILAIRLLSKIEEMVNSPIATSEYKVEEIKKLITDFGL
jgi:hypothetical protein